MRACRDLRKKGFTLIELLVVISIIAVVAGMFLPALARVKMKARSIYCVNNERQMGIATELYTLDNQEKFPGCHHSLPSWVYGLIKYSGTNVYVCPSDLTPENGTPSEPAHSLIINDFLTPHPHGARDLNFSTKWMVPAPSLTLMFGEVDDRYPAYDHFHFADARTSGFTPEKFAGQVAVQRHGRSANYLFCDGHVEEHKWEPRVRNELVKSGSRFIHPLGKSAHEHAAGI
jgi:prepilin-type N-terminal cleavage/methylation domain-containing protein/prepilin-type processing-associated H-X9-DG protein